MRKISDAAKITKTISKVLDVLEKAELNDEQVASVLRAAEETLDIKPPMPPMPPMHPMPSNEETKMD